MNYESMSDFEINALVTSSVFGCEEWEYNDAEFYHCGIDGGGYYSQPILDYCNNPAYAWPIIIENNISINHEIARYKASALVYDFKYERGFNIFVFNSAMGDTSSRAALRAAMIVFLMMNKNTKSNEGDEE